MTVGALLIVLAFAAMLTSTVAFFLSARGREQYLSLARSGYHYFVVLTAAAVVLLFYYFISGDYSIKYVYEYSSSELPLFYLISAFWAGQQGTYLLWLMLLALLGYYIQRRGRQYTDWAMTFYGLINLFFLVVLMVLSPFEKLATPQAEGGGLNPLLHDPWMVVHPPIIFLGYAAVALPCVIAMAALAKKQYDDWWPIALAPAALGAVALAAGNIMGGFWAYKTLGWGGYWAWDPVENSSFIPWMTSVALIHGLLIERARGALRKTNLFMALFTFLLVVYGTFLTRSGVLADFSVHSFVDLGINRYLVGFMVGFSLLALALFVARSRGIKGPAMILATTSRDFSLLISVWLLTLIALMVLAGTSWPLITTIFGNPGTVDTAIYTRVTFPLAVVIGLFLGFAPFMLWGGETWRSLLKKIIPSAVGALVATVIAALAGVHSVSYLVYVLFAAFAFFSNLLALRKYFPGRLEAAGPQIAHFGFALMLIGILGSSAYDTGQKVKIDRGSSAKAFGLTFTYKGMAGEITTPNNEILLDVRDGSVSFEARPKLFWSRQQEGLMKKPYIIRKSLYDLYLAPEQIQDLPQAEGLVLKRGESRTMGGYTIRFAGFDQQAHAAGGPMHFGAKIEVTDSTGRSETVIPSVIFEPGKELGHNDVPLMSGLSKPLRLERIFADQGAVQLSIAGLTPASAPDRLIMEISKKPTMNLLWGGTILLLVGGLLSLRRRWRV